MQVSPTRPVFNVHMLQSLQQKPPVFSPGEPHFWTDPHIAKQMLKAHLNPESDAASRRPETIQRTVDWLMQTLDLQPGSTLLDLGCGPGLYAARLAQAGLRVTGVDFSQNSIDYAVGFARSHGLEINYRCQDYLQLEDKDCYDAALLIYGDLCPLAPEQRTRLLTNIRRALRPGGFFVLDVSTPCLRLNAGLKNGWYAVQSGFWRPNPHLVLEQGFTYPGDIHLDQYVIVEDSGAISVYRNWFQDYTVETIAAELEANHFTVLNLFDGLAGGPCEPNSEWLGVVACS